MQFCVVLAKDRTQMQPDGVIYQLVGAFTNKTVLELSQRSQSRMLGKGVDSQMEGDGRGMAEAWVCTHPPPVRLLWDTWQGVEGL